MCSCRVKATYTCTMTEQRQPHTDGDGPDHHRDEHDELRVNTQAHPGPRSNATDRRQGPNLGIDGRARGFRRLNRRWVMRCLVLAFVIGAVFLAGAEWQARQWNDAYAEGHADAQAACPYEERLLLI